MYQAMEMAPMASVAKPGVRWRGWMSPKRFGRAPMRAIEIAVRAAGKMVVCVHAAADVSTAMIKSLSMPEPSTWLASGARKSSPVIGR